MSNFIVSFKNSLYLDLLLLKLSAFPVANPGTHLSSSLTRRIRNRLQGEPTGLPPTESCFPLQAENVWAALWLAAKWRRRLRRITIFLERGVVVPTGQAAFRILYLIRGGTRHTPEPTYRIIGWMVHTSFGFPSSGRVQYHPYLRDTRTFFKTLTNK
jgi:hypothetical protein